MRPEMLVFVMKGCGACQDLKPLVQRIAAHYATCVDTRILDVDEHDGLADSMGVESTPTAIAVNRHKQPIGRMVGHDGKPERILRLYQTAVAAATSCQVPPFSDV